MDLSTEKQRPQLVEVVNNSSNPTQVEVTKLRFSAGGSLSTTGVVTNLNSFRPSGVSSFNVFLDNILLLQSDGTFVPIPLCTFLSNITNTQLNNALASYKTAYATLVSGVTAATLHYSKMTNTGTITSEVYDLKSND